MMPRYAVVLNGQVENVIVAPLGYEPPAGVTVVALEEQVAGPGWRYDGQTFTPSVREAERVASPSRNRRISFAAFMDLFTEEEQAAIAQAALENPMVKVWYDRVLAANAVDIDSGQTQKALREIARAEGVDQKTVDDVIRGKGHGRDKK